jgi:hypothetical protein
LMAACLRCLVGKPMLYRKGNMCVAKPCTVIDVWQNGDSVQVRSAAGKTRWLHPSDLIEKVVGANKGVTDADVGGVP